MELPLFVTSYSTERVVPCSRYVMINSKSNGYFFFSSGFDCRLNEALLCPAAVTSNTLSRAKPCWPIW